jgi:hypothetical protein
VFINNSGFLDILIYPQWPFFEITFSRDENGKITKCLILTMGMKVEEVKIKK